MPADVEKCVAKIKGINKRTNRPYTQSEKWAICTAMHKKSKKSSFDEEEIVVDPEAVEAVEHGMSECMRKMMEGGRAKTRDEAQHMCESKLAESHFDIDYMWFTLEKNLNDN